MLAVNYSTIRSKLKEYCDKVVNDSETVIITRKNEENVVIISLDEYNELIKAANNLEYVLKLNRAAEQIRNGEVVEHDLIEVEEE